MLRFCALALPSFDEETGKLYFEEDAESPKYGELKEVLDEMGEAPALVLTHSQQYARIVVDRLNKEGISSFEWSGKNSQSKRDMALAAFREGKLRTIVAVITAIGTGTDGLQDATNVEIWMSVDDDPVANQQTMGRLDRHGQQKQVVRIYIHAENTYDEGVLSKSLEAAVRMSATLRKRASK
jgi:ATP-dependent RNA helicase RhlE